MTRWLDQLAAADAPRTKRIVLGFCGVWLLAFALAPLRYYLGPDDSDDERFAWRMFSSVHVADCNAGATERRDGEERALRLPTIIHGAWITAMGRGRSEVITRFLETRCAEQGTEEVRVVRQCTSPSGERITPVVYARHCATGEMKTGGRAMKFIDATLFANVALARPWLLQRLTLLLLAFDCWLLRIERCGRYGVGGFNVAHFGWLDALAPVPSPAAMVGLEVFIGWLAFVAAFVGIGRVAMLVLAAAYTYSWSISQTDSYQHHYLLSWVLVAFVLSPATPASAIAGRDSNRAASSPHGTAWAYTLLLATIAIVYAYAGFSKIEADWRDGSALMRITARAPSVTSLTDFAAKMGVTPSTLFAFLGKNIVVVQWALAVSYVLAIRRDSGSARLHHVVSAIGLVLACSFHLGAEWLDLQIGWFSWYMLLIAVVTFSPERVVVAIARVVSAPIRWLERLGVAEEGKRDPAWITWLLTAAVAGLLVFVGNAVDLPGAVGASLLAAAFCTFVAVMLTRRASPEAARPWLLTCIGASLSLWLAMAASEVRYDYYRFVAGDLQRRGELAAALNSYQKANQYAPLGKAQTKVIDALRRRLEASPPPAPE